MPIYQGTLYTRSLVFKDKTSGDPIDITGWEFKMQIRKSVDEAVLLELTTANGGIGPASGGADGRIQLTLDESQTLGLAIGGYKFDVVRTDQISGGGPTWLFGGKIKVKKPITRSE